MYGHYKQEINESHRKRHKGGVHRLLKIYGVFNTGFDISTQKRMWKRICRFLKKLVNKRKLFKKTLWLLLAPYGWGSTASRPWNHYKEAVYSPTLSSKKFLVLI